MFSYLPLRTYVLPLLIIGSIFSLKAQEEQTIKRYKGWKIEFGVPFTRFSFYDESPADIVNPLEGRNIGEPIGRLGFGVVHIAPQYYIHNNISVGLQYEYDYAFYNTANIFSATGDYYFGKGKNRAALGLGVGFNIHKQINFTDLDIDILNALTSEGKVEEIPPTIPEKTITTLVVSPRFKFHLDSFILHLGYDINTREEVSNGVRFGIAFTLFGEKK